MQRGRNRRFARDNGFYCRSQRAWSGRGHRNKIQHSLAFHDPRGRTARCGFPRRFALRARLCLQACAGIRFKRDDVRNRPRCKERALNGLRIVGVFQGRRSYSRCFRHGRRQCPIGTVWCEWPDRSVVRAPPAPATPMLPFRISLTTISARHELNRTPTSGLRPAIGSMLTSEMRLVWESLIL